MSSDKIIATHKEIVSILSKSEISTNEKEELPNLLKKQSYFDFSRNGIEYSGARTLADALKINNNITGLNIRGNSIEDAGVQAISDALKANNILTHINLSYSTIGPMGAQAIADALKVNRSLLYLDLSGSIGNLGAQAIANALKIDKFTNKDIKLTNTSISNIEQALKIKKVLLKLNLSNNGFKDEGINSIAEMLKVNNSLQELDISSFLFFLSLLNTCKDNYFDDISVLGDAIKCNRSLTDLAFRATDPKVEELGKVLPFNICLLHITKPYYNAQSSEIYEPLKKNEKLQIVLSKRIFKCKNPYLSLLDYKILGRVNVAVIFENVRKLHRTHKTGKTYEECLRQYWELTIGFSKYFLFILGVCKLNQISPFRSHLLGIPKEILTHIGSFLNPKDFPNDKFNI